MVQVDTESEGLGDDLAGCALSVGEDPFVTDRSLLFTVAYEMLGSATEAEDVLQEAWLRWANVDQTLVREPRAYLVRVVTRQALNRMRTMARRRENYVGEWLPEPLLTGDDVAADAELAESVSMAMLTVLETLAPVERAVFVLREVFDTPYDEIAEAIGKTSTTVRQIAHRAREHVASRRPRMTVGPDEQRQVVDTFLAAIRNGDMQRLLDVLAPDVVVVADGGGVVGASRHPIRGAQRVAGLLIRRLRKGDLVLGSAVLNGSPGVLIEMNDALSGAVSFAVEGGRITHIYAIGNPRKLAQLDEAVRLKRS
jgi:RNA polymerase sigma-70 factor (ECF subfamily)